MNKIHDKKHQMSILVFVSLVSACIERENIISYLIHLIFLVSTMFVNGTTVFEVSKHNFWLLDYFELAFNFLLFLDISWITWPSS